MKWAIVLALAGAFLSLGPLAQAQTHPTVAVISVIGDRLTIVTYQPQTGSRLDQNAQQKVALEDDDLDRSISRSVEAAVRAVKPEADTFTVPSRGKTWVELQDNGLELPENGERLREALRAALAGAQATHVVLVSRFRSDARLETMEGHIGAGKIEGLGFYLDRTRRFRRSDTGEAAMGMIAPFSYARISLFRADSMEKLGEVTFNESRALSTARSKSGIDPWAVLSAEEKVNSLKFLTQEGLKRVMPRLLVGF